MIKDKERDILVLDRMLKYCQDVFKLIEQFGKDFELFRENIAYRYSVSMALYQVEELSNHLSNEFKKNHSNIPWQEIRGMRNWIAHNYHEMNIKTTWKTAVEDIPKIAEFCEKVISEQENK